METITLRCMYIFDLLNVSKILNITLSWYYERTKITLWKSESSLHKHNICYIFLKFCQINGSSNITIGKRHCHDNSIKNPITLSFPISSKYWKSFASQKPQGNEYKPLLLPLFTLAVLQTPTLKVISHVVKHKLIDRNTLIVFSKYFLLIRKQTHLIGIIDTHNISLISLIMVWVAIVFWIMQEQMSKLH